MRLNSFISVVGLSLVCSASLAFSQENHVQTLQRLYDEKRVAFSEAADELAYVKALTAFKSQFGSASVVARIKGVIVSAGATGRVSPSEKNEREFNRLRGHLIGLLSQLKQKDPSNVTLKSTVEWGCSTKVASRNTSSFGEEIIEFRTCNQLK